MNRETRRAHGIYVPVGIVPEGVEVPTVDDYPRYMRRHILAMMPGNALTRRVRKQRARIARLYRRMGL